MPNCSPAAKAEGTTEAPGCERDGPWESSVSSECARTPLTNAASIGPHTVLEAATVATSFPPYDCANCKAARPGGNSEPEIMEAKVSKTWCLAFSATSSGSGRVAA